MCKRLEFSAILISLMFSACKASLIRRSTVTVRLATSHAIHHPVKKNLVIYVTKNSKVYLNDLLVTLKQLTIELKKRVNEANEEQVIISSDKDTTYQTIISVIDHVHQAGIDHVSLLVDRKD